MVSRCNAIELQIESCFCKLQMVRIHNIYVIPANCCGERENFTITTTEPTGSKQTGKDWTY